MAPTSKPARPFADEATRPVIGHIVATVTRKEVQPIYSVEHGSVTYGQMLDGWLVDFYKEEENGAGISEFAVELSSDAQHELRSRIKEGRYY